MSVADSLLARQASQIELLPEAIYRQDLQDAIGKESKDALKASLYLLNDDIHNAHEIAGSREGDQDLNLVHAILHRREKDFWNSRWWIDHTDHPLLKDFWAPESRDLEKARRKAKDFSHRVEAWHKKGARNEEEEDNLKEIQHRELMALLKYFS